MENKIYLGTLWEGNYELTVIDTTAAKVRKALLKEFVRSYQSYYGIKPDEEEKQTAEENICVEEMTLGKVEWR